MYLFDTSAIIDWLYQTRLGEMIDGPISTSAISIAELIPTAREKDKETLNSVNRFISKVKVVVIDEIIAREASSLKYQLRRIGQDKPVIDLLIGASAKLNNLTLVTLDEDFKIISEVGDFELMYVDDNL